LLQLDEEELFQDLFLREMLCEKILKLSESNLSELQV